MGVPLPAFPKTYGKSYFYMKLTEEELQERVKGIEKWIRECLSSYLEFSEENRELLMDFLGFSESDDVARTLNAMIRHGKVLQKECEIIEDNDLKRENSRKGSRKSYHENASTHSTLPTWEDPVAGCGCLPAAGMGLFGLLFGFGKQKQTNFSKGKSRNSQRRGGDGNSSDFLTIGDDDRLDHGD